MPTILDELEAAEKDATKGPWFTDYAAEVRLGNIYGYQGKDLHWGIAFNAEPPDAALIVLLRNHAADLIAVARAAREAQGLLCDCGTEVYDGPKREALLANALAPLLKESSE